MKIRPLVTISLIIIAILCNSSGFQPSTAYTDAQPSAAPPSPIAPLALEQSSGSNTYPAFAVYPYSASGEGLVYIPDTAAPGTWDYIKSVPSGNTYYAGDFVGGDYDQLYVLSNNNYELHTLDTTTVTDTLIGASVPISGQVWAGATGSSDGVLYACAMGETTSHLYTINTTTGAASVVGEITNAPCTVDIAINAAGEMYGLDLCSDVLVQIDPATGAGTVLGPVGFDAIYAQGMDFAPNGDLYLAAFRDSSYVDPWGELRIADTSTGDSTLVDRFPNDEEVVILAFARPMSQQYQLLQNPGFENGWDHWQTENYPSLSGTSHSGAASAYFYGEEIWMWQELYFPTDTFYASLSYWIYGMSAETEFGKDLFCGSFWDQTGQIQYSPEVCFDLEYFNYEPLVWKHRVAKLSADTLANIAGKTVLLIFKQTQEDWGQYAQTSHAYVDDISLAVYLSPGPIVTGITPASGFTGESLHVTNLAGDFFQAGASVQLVQDGQTPINAANVAVLDQTRITCDLDLTGAATGQWDVVVTNSNAQSGTLPGGFTITDPFPTVSSITPASGANSGVVHITDLAGDNFLAGASVRLTKSGQADINAANVNVLSENQITCDLDLTGTATGQWDVVVTNTDAQSGTLPGGFRISSKVWNGSVNSDWHTAANWTPSGAPTISDDVFIPDESKDPIISNDNAAVKSLIVAAGAVLDLTGRTLTVEDALTNQGTLQQTLDVTTGETANFMRITNQAGDQTRYYGLDLTPTGASTALKEPAPSLQAQPRIAYHHETGQTDVAICGTDSEGLSASDMFQVLVADKTWNGNVSSDWHAAANWTPSGAPTSGDDVLIPNTSNDPVISNGDATVNNLLINAGAVLELTNRTLTVEGALTNNGALGQEQRVPAGNTANLLRITNLAGTQTKYYGLDITPVAPTWTHSSANVFQAPGGVRPEGQSLAPIVLLPSGAPAFAAEVINDDLVSFDTDTPATLNTVANLGANYFGGDFLDGDFSKMYALDYLANNFVSINTATAAVTVIGTAVPTSDHIWTGLAGDPTDGVLYGSSTSESGSTLYTFDVSTGAPTTVNNVSNAPGLIGIAINAAGEMYGLDIVNDVLVSIDKATGAGTVIGSVGFDADYAQGMDFDEEADVLYLAAYNADASRAELRVADTVTGGTTLVGVFSASTEIDALAIATGGNTPPLAVNDAYTTTQDTPLEVAAPGVLGNDVDGDPLTAVLDVVPANGAVSLGADGSFIYTPTAGFSGADSFSYHANDGVSDSNIATVTLNVTTIVNTPPTLAGLPDQNVPLDGSLDNAIDLWSYASDAQDADSALSFTIVNSPAVSAGVSLDSNRYVDIMPAAGWTGVTDVEVQVQDTAGLTATDSFQVRVASVVTPTSVTVSISGNQRCPGRATGVKRCFDIAPASALTATVRFYLSEAERDGQVLDDLLVFHQAGDWIEEPGPYTRGGAGDAQYVQAQNVDDFSLFALDSHAINVHVLVYGNQFCPGRYTGVRRCFDVTPSAALTATVRFYLSEAERGSQALDDLLVYRYGASWIEEPGPYTRGGAGDAQYVQAQDIQDLTLFALDWFNGHIAVFLPLVQRR